MSIEYRRRTDERGQYTSDVWHHHTGCRWWPKADYRMRVEKPRSGEVCNECRAKARRDKQEKRGR